MTLTAHETQAAVLHLEEPVGPMRGAISPWIDGTSSGGNQAAAQYLVRQIARRTPSISFRSTPDVLAQVGIGARHADLRHAQTDRGPALLLGRLLSQAAARSAGFWPS